ncbi:MAG: ABC transporter ATP-binding protein [Betaproteobacteria bacterium RIFCSPLOWO2_12_FULL_62_58]|nr:MAG: ABC transporter ATP-binding protein [Betaproteobacteria bacterium RIFCSPLOWO2_12_FULL_62_58]
MNNNCPLLRIENLRTWIDTGETVVRAVDGVSLAVERGETFALLGESGCGKSVTALSVMRLLPDAGQIVGGTVELDGENLLALPEIAMRDVRGARIAMIFQEPMLSLNPVMTAGEQIAETLRRHTDLEGADIERRVLELLDAVRIPDAARRRHEYPFQFSGGMKQRVMIAMALACNPELLIADEPTTALDVTIQAQVLDILRELQSRRRMSVLLITHDLAVVAEMAHRVAVMYAGEVVETADRETFFSRPAHPYSRKLFDSLPARTKRGGALAVIRGTVPPLTRDFVGCRFAERCDHAWDLCRQATPDWHDLGGGQGVRCHLFAKDEQMGEGIGERREAKKLDVQSIAASGVSHLSPLSSLLSVKDLKVHFPIHKGVFKHIVGRVKAVDGVSLTIQSGKTLGLVGESGCGKTTVGKSVLRLIEPTAGQVMLGGEDVLRLGRAQLRTRRRHAQIIFQDPYSSLNPRMRVMETIEEGMAALGLGASRDERQARIDHLLTEVGLAPETKYRYPHEFSGGQRQRVAIARALAVEPQLIVCDEPTSALDVSVQAQILNLLKQLQSKKGLAYLFISHNIAVIEFLAHEVAVMYLGRIVERGTVEEVLDGPKHPYTRALLSAVPVIDRITEREVIRLQGDLPSPVNPPAGCHFHPRCPAALPQCRQAYPKRTDFSATHSTHCHLYPVTQKQ